MNTHETEFTPTAFTAQNVRRQAEQLRAKQTARVFVKIFNSIAGGYARLASYGASMSNSYQTLKALY